jgi:hypothetical protein
MRAFLKHQDYNHGLQRTQEKDRRDFQYHFSRRWHTLVDSCTNLVGGFWRHLWQCLACGKL